MREDVWLGTWSSNPTGLPGTSGSSRHTVFKPRPIQGTVRYRIRISAGGKGLRVRLSNEYRDKPLGAGALSVGLAGSGFRAVKGSLQPLTFGGRRNVNIPGGAHAISDPARLPLDALSELVVSVYLPKAITMLSPELRIDSAVIGDADLTLEPAAPRVTAIAARPVVSAVDVTRDRSIPVLAVLGDSIVDGNVHPRRDARGWTGLLSQRLVGANLSVVNAGIGGNRLLASESLLGRSALARLQQDIFSVSGVSHLIVAIGINDIGRSDEWRGASGNSTGASGNRMSALRASMIAAYRQIVSRAHQRDIAVIGTTLLPFAGSDFHSTAHERIRCAVNDWIRSENAFDAVVDFDAILKDPAQGQRLKPDFDCGDHLHPNRLGERYMALAVDRSIIQESRVRVP